MPSKGPVNVNRQTFYAIIPGLDCLAAKQIDKLRRLSIIGLLIVSAVGFGGYGIAYLIGQYNMVTIVIVVLIVAGVYLPIAAYLVGKWSIEWNKKFNIK